MRALFEDRRFEAANSRYEISGVTFPAGKKRDLWLRFHETFGVTTLYVFKTRAEAIEAEPGDTYLASKGVEPGDWQSLVMVDNAGTAPDMAGLVVRARVTEVTEGDEVVWGYTSDPGTAAAEDIKTLILAKCAAGLPFEDFIDATDSTGAGKVYICPPGVAVPAPSIVIVPGELEIGRSSAGTFECVYPIEVQIYCEMLDSPEAAALACRRYTAEMQSLLIDEHRTLYGACFLEYGGSQPVQAVSGELNYVRSVITMRAVFETVYTDR